MKNKKEIIVVGLIIGLAVLLSISQTILYLFNTPAGHVYPYVHNFIEDYYYYLHIIRQGFDGSLLATSRLTTEVNPGRFVVVFFLFLGHIARILHLSLPSAYTWARVVGGGLLLVFSFVLIRLIYPRSFWKRIAALVLVSFGTYWWGWQNGQPIVLPLVHEWTELDPIFRWSYIPHHLWSKVFMLISFIALYKSCLAGSPRVGAGRRALLGKNYWKWLGVLIVAIICMGFSSPVTLATFIPTVGIWFLLYYLFLFLCSAKEIGGKKGWPYARFLNFLTSDNQGDPRLRDKPFPHFYHSVRKFEENAAVAKLTYYLLPWIVALGLGVFVAIYHRIVQQDVFPWTSYLSWEKVQYNLPLEQYIKSFGPTLIFFLIAIPFLLRSTVGQLLISWVISGFLMLYGVEKFLPLSNIRFLEGYQFIPVGIGAIEGLAIIFKRQWMRNGILVILLIYFAIGIKASFDEHKTYVAQNRLDKRVYIPKEIIDAFSYLDRNTKKESVVLAPLQISTMIPAFSSNRVVVGHPMMTQNYTGKRQLVDSFFSFRDKNLATSIVKDQNISYILLYPSGGKNEEDFLKTIGGRLIYQSQTVAIYSVVK